MVDFDRARKRDRLRWAGDPERWGSGSSVTTLVARALPGVPVPVAFGSQILRAQTRDLIAIAWDLAATWSFEGLAGDDAGTLSLEIALGTGQATSTLFWQLSEIRNGTSLTQPTAMRLGWTPTLDAPVLPYVALATVPAASSGPVVFAPAVPAGYMLHATSLSIAAVLAQRTNAYVFDSSGAGPNAGSIGITGTMPGPIDWWLVAGDTPSVALFPNATGAGEQVDVAIAGELVRVGSTGAAVTSSPIVACAIAARPVLQVVRIGGADHTVTARLTAHCSPRSWVP